LDCIHIRQFLVELAEAILRAKGELNMMDSVCGDGDFGTTMFVAFKHVREALNITQDTQDSGVLFNTTGQAIIFSAGGAAGPLFGTLFLEIGKTVKGKAELTLSDLAEAFESAERKIKLRGGASVGDKTLLDSLDPAVLSLKSLVNDKGKLTTALVEAARAAREGYQNTANLVAKQGKARYLGKQTLGHRDPGARVISLMFDALEAASE
jgi:phosphoenolpyruvate---glycerone phosphotransferase subunit DhaL